MIFKPIKIFLINILIFFSLIVITELFIFIFFNKSKLDCTYLMCSQTLNYKINDDYEVIYKRDEYGFRDRHKKLEKIDILVVGGSTTDQRWSNDEDTWINQLQESLKKHFNKDIDVVNSGIDGQSSFGHLWNFNNWYNKLDYFSPKYIIFYMGINEDLNLSPKELKKNRLRADAPLDTSNLNLFIKIKNILKKNNGIIYRAHKFINKVLLKNEHYREVYHSPERKKKNYKIPHKLILTNINSERNLLENLQKLYESTLKINATPIFVTQKTLRGNMINDQIFSIDEFDYYSYEKKISNIIIDFCKKQKIYCINANEKLNFLTEDTYDLVHLTPKGSKKVSKLLFDQLKFELKF